MAAEGEGTALFELARTPILALVSTRSVRHRLWGCRFLHARRDGMEVPCPRRSYLPIRPPANCPLGRDREPSPRRLHRVIPASTTQDSVPAFDRGGTLLVLTRASTTPSRGPAADVILDPARFPLPTSTDPRPTRTVRRSARPPWSHPYMPRPRFRPRADADHHTLQGISCAVRSGCFAPDRTGRNYLPSDRLKPSSFGRGNRA